MAIQKIRTFKSLALLLVVGLIAVSCLSPIAYATEEDDLRDTVQSIIDNAGLQAHVEVVSGAGYTQLWNEVSSKPGAVDFLNKVKNEGFQLYQENATFKISDDLSSNSMYYLSSAYKNNAGEFVCVIFVYDPLTSSVMRVFSSKVDTDGQGTIYYEYEYAGALMMRGDFNDLSFYCGMTGATVCAIYAVMFMALPVVAAVAGLGCSAAFAFVCAFA